MTAELIIAPEAQQDVDEAYSWYEDRRPGLGEEFLSCVDACIQTISRMPELYVQKFTKSIVVLWSGDFHTPFITSLPVGR
jgi:plasmid stabilization system protein ParE